MTKTQNDQPTETELHQLAGSMLAPLFTWQGKDVYPVCGAEGDDEGDDGGSDSETDDDDTDDDTGSGKDKGGSGTVSQEDFEKLRAQLQAADRNRDAAEKKLKAIEDGKKDELTKATERAEELEKVVAARDKELGDLRLQNAFLTATTGITWHDPADALALAERQGYLDEVVAEDGKVDGKKLGAKLKELAKAKPHLVKKSSEEGSTGNTRDQNGGGQQRSGAPVGSKGGRGNNQGGDEIPSRYAKHLR